MEFLSYLGAIVLAVCAFTGAQPWLRHGLSGVHFIWSRDFAEALRNWQAQQVVNKICEREAHHKLGG